MQACVSFILTSLERDDDLDWVYLVSRQVYQQLARFGVDTQGAKTRVFDASPARSRQARNQLLEEVERIQPDAVFTFFGPAYVRFKQPHLLGVADGWVTHSTWLAYKSLNGLKDMLVTLLRCVYKGWWYRYADFWVVEANAAAVGLARRMRVDRSRIKVVSNSCAPHYFRPLEGAFDPGTDKSVKILTLSSYYPHKDLELIPKVAYQLKKVMNDDDFAFIVTLTENADANAILDEAVAHGVSDNVRNIGPVDIKDGPALYASVDLAFVPTLLETFTAAYPEAMAMNKPIVTTDLDFARDICKDAAAYFSPGNASDAAGAIFTVLDNEAVSSEMVANGQEILKQLPSAEERYAAYGKILKEMMATADSLK